MDVKLGTLQRIAMSVRFSPKFQELLSMYPEYSDHDIERIAVARAYEKVIAMIDESDPEHETILLVRALSPEGLSSALAHEDMHVALYRLGMPEAARAYDCSLVENLIDEWFGIRFPWVRWSGNE